MRQPVASPARLLSRAGTDGRVYLAVLLLIGGAACLVVAQRSPHLTGPGPLVAQVATASELGDTRPSTPWGAFLRIVQAAQENNRAYLTSHSAGSSLGVSAIAEWTVAFPRFISEHRRGKLVSIDYALIAPPSRGAAETVVLPRSAQLQQTGGTWLLRVPG